MGSLLARTHSPSRSHHHLSHRPSQTSPYLPTKTPPAHLRPEILPATTQIPTLIHSTRSGSRSSHHTDDSRSTAQPYHSTKRSTTHYSVPSPTSQDKTRPPPAHSSDKPTMAQHDRPTNLPSRSASLVSTTSRRSVRSVRLSSTKIHGPVSISP